jgi:hypothetical protein
MMKQPFKHSADTARYEYNAKLSRSEYAHGTSAALTRRHLRGGRSDAKRLTFLFGGSNTRSHLLRDTRMIKRYLTPAIPSLSIC